jgi:hypothetical protein
MGDDEVNPLLQNPAFRELARQEGYRIEQLVEALRTEAIEQAPVHISKGENLAVCGARIGDLCPMCLPTE